VKSSTTPSETHGHGMRGNGPPLANAAAMDDHGPTGADIWAAWHLDTRVSAVQEATKRARVAFFICIFAACASGICLWNAYFSWDRGFGFATLDSEANSTHDDLIRDQLRAWVDSQSVTVNLLGIHIAVSDFAASNSAAQYFFVMYLLLTLRRENRELGQLLRDLRDQTDNVGRAVFSAISAYMVFNLNRNDDNEIRSLSQDGGYRPRTIRFIRVANRVMFWAPLLVVILTIICDCASLFVTGQLIFSSPLRSTQLYRVLPLSSKVYAFSMDAVAAGFAGFIAYLSVHALRYETATRDVLEDFRKKLIAHGVVQKSEAED
jgi:hypothetical protein